MSSSENHGESKKIRRSDKVAGKYKEKDRTKLPDTVETSRRFSNQNGLMLSRSKMTKVKTKSLNIAIPEQNKNNNGLNRDDRVTNLLTIADSKANNFEYKNCKFSNYISDNGISMVFNLIFEEVIFKRIPKKEVFSYTARRLRQIGEDLAKLNAFGLRERRISIKFKNH